MPAHMNVLILGGTTEATAIGRALAGDARFNAVLSFAGRTSRPLAQAIPTRTGGFGGIAGLAAYLRERRVEALIDATHPFAAQMTAHAVASARETGVPLLAVLRPAWRPEPGDRWTEVASMAEAARALGTARQRVLLTVGQKDLAPFAAAPWHDYVIRSIEPPQPETLPPSVTFIAARGPFHEADERALLTGERIAVMVTKNSGGDATEAKLAAARSLGLPVVMVARPPAPEAEIAPSAEAAVAWLHRHHAAPRGV